MLRVESEAAETTVVVVVVVVMVVVELLAMTEAQVMPTRQKTEPECPLTTSSNSYCNEIKELNFSS